MNPDSMIVNKQDLDAANSTIRELKARVKYLEDGLRAIDLLMEAKEIRDSVISALIKEMLDSAFT
jgi:hypothetical protein